MRKPVNALGFLSLVALLGFLYFPTKNAGLLGFFGFAGYARYFSVQPDELFQRNVRRAATAALFAEFLCLVPLTYAFVLFGDVSRALARAFGLSFAAAIFVFTIAMMVLEWREQRGLAHD